MMQEREGRRRIRYRRHDASVFLYAFDLIELNGDDLRREPLEVRKATLASVLAKAASGIRLNEPPSLRAMTRKPSCLISCSHASPVGGCGALVGRHGGMKPSGRGMARLLGR
jgi:hypothetical protein